MSNKGKGYVLRIIYMENRLCPAFFKVKKISGYLLPAPLWVGGRFS